MSIHDFYSKFMSTDEESSLLGMLRRLTLFDDPKAMFDEEPANDWVYWSGASAREEILAL